MKYKNLEEKIQAHGGNVVEMLRNSPTGPNVYPVVKPEYTNWRDEQRAWQETCVLFNQSYHMSDLYVKGPDALKLLSYVGINSMAGFAIDKAKQLVCCTHDGYVIGDVILFYLAENTFSLVGRPPLLNWVEFQAKTGNFNVELEWDHRAADQSGSLKRKYYRFQVQGPNAIKLVEKVTGQAAPQLKFFNMTEMTIGGKKVRALRHGMAGQAGYELFGPYEDGEAVKQALVDAGDEFGLRLVGALAYSSNTLESGWIPSPLPAIYSGEKQKSYREYLPADGFEGILSMGGSFLSDKIEDYYLTPYELGYGFFVKFDHDFIGREALEKMVKEPQRKKVTLALNNEDVMKVLASQFEKGPGRGKFIAWPSAVYSMAPMDAVLHNGKNVGVSTWVGYSSNERKMLTLAMLDEQYAEPGTEVTFVWGEENGGTKKATVEPHTQMQIRAIVSPVPYAEVVRKEYVESGWRKEGKGS